MDEKNDYFIYKVDLIQNIQNKKFIKILSINIIIFFLFFGLFIFHKHFSTDDYYAYHSQYAVAIDVTALSYRNCIGFLYYIFDKMHINVVENQIFFGCFLIFTLSWCTTIVIWKINQNINVEERADIFCILELGAIILFANSFVGEWIWFTVSYVQWILSVFGSVYAAVIITSNQNHAKNWFLSLFCLFVVAGSYQIMIADYVYLVMFFIFIDMKGRWNKKSFWLIIRAAVPAILSIVLNIVLTNLMFVFGLIPNGVGRMKITFLGIKKSLSEILVFQKKLWIDGIGLLPKYSAFVCLLILMVILLMVLYKKVCVTTCFYIFLLCISGQSVMYMAQIMSGSGMSARMLVPIFGTYAVLLWLICYYSFPKFIKHRIFLNIAGSFFTAFLFANIVSMYSNTIDAIKTNTIDKFYIDEILANIDDYEQRQNVKVTSVGFCYDANLTYKYYACISNQDYYGEMSTRAFATDWSNYTSFCFYSNRNLTRIDVPEQIKNAFAYQDWAVPDLEKQIVFDDDKVYICIY